MNVPVNGLRLLAVEISILLATTVLAFLIFRLVRKSVTPPSWSKALLAKSYRSVLLVIAVALIGRALLLPWVGIPQPHINDEYSYLLMGDTFAHLRLTNPTPASWPHFETFHVNMTPTYHSKYAVSQGLVLGFGEFVFHQPWIGIYLSTALMCGAICWALQAFVPPAWALIAALLATVRFALFSYWMNSYWGGSVAAVGGAVALGAVVRLFQPGYSERQRKLLAAVFAAALLILATSRPYEGFAFSIPLLVYFVCQVTRGKLQQKLSLRTTLLPVVTVGLAGVVLMGYYNLRTTGNALLLPHLLNERVYSPLPLFMWQQAKPPLTFHDPAFAKFFQVTISDYHYEDLKSLPGLAGIEINRFAADWFFYIGAALSFPALLGFISIARQPGPRIAVWAACSTAIALALCTYTMLHYAAPMTVTIYIFVAEGLNYLWQQGKAGERAFTTAVLATVLVTSLLRQNGNVSPDVYPYPNTRELVAEQLANQPGKQLVLVSYDMAKHYPGDELVHNWADFASQKILWARSKGDAKDADLCTHYGDRSFWGLNTDDESYTLTPLDLCKAGKQFTATRGVKR